MRGISRRDFLKYCMGSATALGLDLSILGKLEKLLAAGGNGVPTVIWLNGANCTGCTVSLANMIRTEPPRDVADLLVNCIDLAFHPNLMGAAGDLAVQNLNRATSGEFILAVDGGIPTAFNGHTCILWSENGREVTAMEAMRTLVPKAAATLCIGTCSSFGGIPSGRPNPTGVRSVSELTGRQTINIPGCPAHPDWIVWTVAQLLAGQVPALDSSGRPAALFRGEGCNVHKNCPRKEREEAKTFGVEGYCLKELGCKGERTQALCPRHLWNNGTNWCVGANGVCLGCTERGFPDAFSPFYKYEFEPVGTQVRFSLDKAEWLSDGSELRVEGNGDFSAVVSVKSAASGALLGTTTVDSSGRWRFSLWNPTRVPCRVLTESNGQSLEREVSGAPGNCDDGVPQVETELKITSAEWRKDSSELRVRGVGEVGAIVSITNAGTGASLGMTVVNDNGSWRLARRRPSPVPCRVRAESAGQVTQSSVRNAPRSCA